MWRKAIGFRRSNFDFIISHIIYYGLILYLVITDEIDTIKAVILDLSTTLFPFIILLIPFLIFSKKFNKRIKAKQLFRFLIILRLQLLPVLLTLYLIADYFDLEFLFIISNNLIWVFWILATVGIPIILKIKLTQKIAWIIVNYLLLNFVFFLIPVISSPLISTPEQTTIPNVNLSDDEEILNGIQFIKEGRMDTISPSKLMQFMSVQNPDLEYHWFNILSPRPFYVNKFYFAVVNGDPGKGFIIKPQYVSLKLFQRLLKALPNFSKLKKATDTAYSYTLDRKSFNLSVLENLKKEFNFTFDLYKRNVEIMINHTNFDSNRKYFQLLRKHLTTYEKFHTDYDLIDTIMYHNQIGGMIVMEDSSLAVLYMPDTTRNFFYTKELKAMEMKFEKRHVASDFTMRIALFPCRSITFLLDNLN